MSTLHSALLDSPAQRGPPPSQPSNEAAALHAQQGEARALSSRALSGDSTAKATGKPDDGDFLGQLPQSFAVSRSAALTLLGAWMAHGQQARLAARRANKHRSKRLPSREKKP